MNKIGNNYLDVRLFQPQQMTFIILAYLASCKRIFIPFTHIRVHANEKFGGR